MEIFFPDRMDMYGYSVRSDRPEERTRPDNMGRNRLPNVDLWTHHLSDVQG